MPIYEFECPNCSKVSEFSLKMADAYPTDCPLCGANGLQKIMSRTAFVLNGGGWYNEAYSKKPTASDKAPADAAAAATPAAPATGTPATGTPAAASAPAAAPAAAETKAAPAAKPESKST